MYTIIYMKQFNINITREFEKDLKSYMKLTGIKQKALAVRQAIREAVARMESSPTKADFRQLLGIGLKAPLNQKAKFKSEDDLWS